MLRRYAAVKSLLQRTVFVGFKLPTGNVLLRRFWILWSEIFFDDTLRSLTCRTPRAWMSNHGQLNLQGVWATHQTLQTIYLTRLREDEFLHRSLLHCTEISLCLLHVELSWRVPLTSGDGKCKWFYCHCCIYAGTSCEQIVNPCDCDFFDIFVWFVCPEVTEVQGLLKNSALDCKKAEHSSCPSSLGNWLPLSHGVSLLSLSTVCALTFSSPVWTVSCNRGIIQSAQEQPQVKIHSTAARLPAFRRGRSPSINQATVQGPTSYSRYFLSSGPVELL